MVSVSVIVLNYNGAELLAEALPTLAQQSHDNLEIMVADNGSTDGSESVAEEFGARFIALRKNFGFALGNNLAAAEAMGEFLFFVNNDMRFSTECVAALAETLEQHPEVFSVDCVQYAWGTRRVVHGGTVLAPGRWNSTPLPFLEVNPTGFVDRFAAVPWTCAGNMMVRRSAFAELGGFDPAFFMNAEDVDLCLRAWMRGWASAFVPPSAEGAWVEHRVGATNRRLGDWRLSRATGNYLRFVLKTAAPITSARSVLCMAARDMAQALRGRLKELSGTALGVLWNIYLLRDTWLARLRALNASRYCLEDVLGLFLSSPEPLHPAEALSFLRDRSQHQALPRGEAS